MAQNILPSQRHLIAVAFSFVTFILCGMTLFGDGKPVPNVKKAAGIFSIHQQGYVYDETLGEINL
jgi:hypothetical protein